MDAEEDRISRRPFFRTVSRSASPALPRMAWCMVGTAVYQVGAIWAIQSKKSGAMNPGVHTTDPPEDREARRAATRPCI
jgi:hypothetical protein